jgi:hypothetical protein
LCTGTLLFALTTIAEAQQYTNRARFGIPFQFDAEELTRIGAVEIRLFLSTDDGENWRDVQNVAPAAGRFQFEAPEDGKYSFAVRTVDAQGRLHPSAELSPELHVIVDQAVPDVTLTLVSNREREVTALWQAHDANLDVDSLHLEFSVNGGQWEEVAGVDAAVGQIRFDTGEQGRVSVRMTAADRAGNPQIMTREIEVGESSEPESDNRDPFTPDFDQPVAQGPGHAVLQDSAGIGNPIIRPGSLRGTTGTTTPSSLSTSEATASEESASQARRVNSLTFRIGYEVAEVGPSGVGQVEFFITEDDGAHWYHYGTDEDGVSPFEVTVPRDGSYGFSMRVKSGIGLSNPPPQPEDAPDSYIVVDRMGPEVTLLPLTQGGAEQQNELVIEWSIQDDLLSDRPVSLFYSTNPDQGEWEPITGWMANTERFVWAVSPQFRKSVFIRLDARDAAGNVTSVVSDAPVVLDRSRPQARITDVETVHP